MIRPDGLPSDCFILSYLSFQCGTLVVDLKGVIMAFGCVLSIQSFHRLESGIMMEDFVCCFEVRAIVSLFLFGVCATKKSLALNIWMPEAGNTNEIMSNAL